MGLDDLVYTGWLSGRSTALRIVGPTGTRALVDALEAAHAPGRDALGVSLELPAEGGRFVVVEVGDGHAEDLGGPAPSRPESFRAVRCRPSPGASPPASTASSSPAAAGVARR
jgi:hypothetical protein